MRTTNYHPSNLGAYAPIGYADGDGYVRMHDAPRYAVATNAQLGYWRDNSRSRLVRAASATALAERQLQARRDAK